MHICVLINDMTIGGAQRVVLDDIRVWKSKGHIVTLVTLLPEPVGNSFMPECLATSVTVISAGAQTRSLLGKIKYVRRVFAQEKPDIVFTHLFLANTIGRIAAKVQRVSRVICFEHNVYDTLKSKKSFWVDRVLQYFCTGIVAVSGAVQDSLIRHGIKNKKIFLLSNSIDTERFADAVPAVYKHVLPVPEGLFVYLFVGRLIHQKGVDVLLRAYRELPEHVQESSCVVIVGEGEERERLETLQSSLGTKHVYFLGARTDVPSLLKGADCVVLPSRWEGLPIVLMEAMAAGCPIISARFDSLSELLAPDEQVLVVPKDDVHAHACAMQGMFESESVRHTFAAKAAAYAVRFSSTAHADTLLTYAAGAQE